MKSKIVSIEKMAEIVSKAKQQEKKVIATSGCFDIIHAGHVTYLEEAKDKGDILIVFLNSDVSVKSLKGNNRHIVNQNERAIVIAGLECVDYVSIFDEKTPCQSILKCKPDVFIKGGDYRGKRIPEMHILEEYGGHVEYVSMVNGCSSTNIIERIKETIEREKKK